MNYAELNAAIQSYAENYETSFITNIPTFIKQAEHRIYNSVMLPIFRKEYSVIFGFGADLSSITVATDFIAVYSIKYSNNSVTQYLINKDLTYLDEAYPNSGSGTPKYYALNSPNVVGAGYDDRINIQIRPAATAGSNATMIYYAYPNSIVDDGTSWLGDHYDPILLYGAMREAMLYMKAEQDLVAYYENKYQEALAQLKRLGEGLEMGDAYRGGQVKIPEKAL